MLGEFAVNEGFRRPFREYGAPRILMAGFNGRYVFFFCGVHVNHSSLSSWIHEMSSGFAQRHAGSRKSLEARLLFSRLIALSEMVVGAHFVFNGPNQPEPKPGREVKAAPLLLVQRFQDMLTAFGFSWHVVGHTFIVFRSPS